MKKNTKAYIGMGIALVIIILLLNPGILPIPESMKSEIMELEKNYFLIQQSGRVTISHILTVILALAVVFLVYNILQMILISVGKKNERARTVTTLILALLRYTAVAIAILWSLSILGVNTTAVLAGVGLLGLILGFGAQSLIEDIITGMFIIFEGQYSIGDIIILDDFRGVVKAIGVRTTSIEDAGGNVKVVNNSDIRNFQNRSKNMSLAICDCDVSYGTDIPRMEKIIADNLDKIYQANTDVFTAKPVYYGVEALGESGVTVRVCVPCREANIFPAKRRLNREIKLLFDANGIEIPFPQVVVHQGD